MSTALLPNAPIPINDPIARPARRKGDPQAGLVSPTWVDWFTRQGQVVNQSAVRIASKQLTGQTASIGATDFSGAVLAEGLYEIKYFVRVTTPAGTSSSLQVLLDWKRGGATQTRTGAALVGNATTTSEGASHFAWIDGSSPVRYTVTYGSVGAPAMVYELALVLTRVNA